MKPETVKYITELLQSNLEEKKGTMLRTIEDNYSDNGIALRIKEYQAAYHALDEFEDFIEDR